MNPQRLEPPADDEASLDGSTFRSLELTVLQQVREGMSLLNANMRTLNSKVDSMHERVMAIEFAKFDKRIEEVEGNIVADLRRTEVELLRQISEIRSSTLIADGRQRAAETLLARYGAFLAVFGTVGGAVIAAMATKVFGAG